MYIAMNRFKVQNGTETAVEDIWKNRDSPLNEMKGFREFHLLRGPVNEAEGYTLYASHTTWDSYDDFSAWTEVGEFPRRAQECWLVQGIICRPSAIRRLFGRRRRLSPLFEYRNKGAGFGLPLFIFTRTLAGLHYRPQLSCRRTPRVHGRRRRGRSLR